MIRLAFDIGTNSIGWWLYDWAEDRPGRVLDGGVRIFADGREAKSNASLAVARREARAMRRRRDRYLRRRAHLMQQLAEAGLMPRDPAEAKALEGLDPYALRARGLRCSLPLPHLGRALFHLNQRRGFKSNRKTDAGSNEGGLIKEASARLDQAIMAAGAQTYGAFLHQRRQAAAGHQNAVPPVRTRLVLRQESADGKAEPGYDFYPDRKHLEAEFHALWDTQQKHHPELTDALRAAFFETIFFQRPLKAPVVGRCPYVDEPRLPKAHPLTQQRVLYETVNHLKITADGRAARPLTLSERDLLIAALNGKEPLKSPGGTKLSFTALAKVLKLREGERFTLQSTARDGIACDPVRASLAHRERFGPQWAALSWPEQWALLQRLREETDSEALIQWLMQTYPLDRARAENIAAAPLPEGYARLGLTATQAVLEKLKAEVITYDKAVAACGWHHSDQRLGEGFDKLPYYGAVLPSAVLPGSNRPEDDEVARYGRLTNPTVHIGLNQLRRLVNRVMTVYGKPDQIVVELARDLKQTKDEREADERRIRDNTAAALRRGEVLRRDLGQKDTGANRALLRLWEEMNPDPLKRLCPYTGTPISAPMLFSGECDVDHILPYSRTLDDSSANKTLCLKEANRAKANKTPWEAWGGTAQWERIAAYLAFLPEAKRWRFAPDAMTRYEGERDFEARALVDTQYLSRLARQYLDSLYGEGGHVWVVPGRLTEMLRRHWGLNSLLHDDQRDTAKAKNRMDHRHHALDAAVIGATDRALIQRMARQAGQAAAQGLEALAARIAPPWEGFREAVKAQLDRMIVSHKPDHGVIDPSRRAQGRDSTTGQLHNDTAYGLTGLTDGKLPLVVTRKAFDALTPGVIAKIRDPILRQALETATAGLSGAAFAKALRGFSAQSGPYQRIRHVRIIEPGDVIEIKDKEGKAYKGYLGGSNHCYEVWQMPDGSLVHHVTSTFAAHQGAPTRPHPAARRLLRLFKKDMVRLDSSKFGPLVATVEKFDMNGTIVMVGHNEANADYRYGKENEDVYIRLRAATLMKAGARRVIVDEMGRIRDPGPPTHRFGKG